MIELAAEMPASQVSVSELCARAGVTRRTFYNRFVSPQQALCQALRRELSELGAADARRRAHATESPSVLLRLANADVVDHVSRHRHLYCHALAAPEDAGVFDVLVDHFVGYSVAFIRRSRPADLTDQGIELVAQFVAHGFAGAIRAWLRDPSVTREALEEAVASAAPSWWHSNY
jgi:AcrR family transcriptional regulator